MGRTIARSSTSFHPTLRDLRTEDVEEEYPNVDTSSGWDSEPLLDWMADGHDGYTSDHDNTAKPDADGKLEVAFDSMHFTEVSDTDWFDEKITSRHPDHHDVVADFLIQLARVNATPLTQTASNERKT